VNLKVNTNMEKPVIAQKSPFVIKLEPGTYWWCACGMSNNQPFCDGSHKGSDFTPQKLVLEKEEQVALCGCKMTGSQPRCDGTHRSL